MFNRGFFRVIVGLALIGLLVVIGIGVYDAGVSQGIAEAGRNAVASGAAAPVYVYPGAYPGHWGGFGFFGIFFWILGIFLIFGLLRAAFGWGRWGGRGGPGGWDHAGGRHGYLDDWHRRAHDERQAPPAEPTGSRQP
jgi:hypothetical protein